MKKWIKNRATNGDEMSVHNEFDNSNAKPNTKLRSNKEYIFGIIEENNLIWYVLT
jgi:hypothetical protein